MLPLFFALVLLVAGCHKGPESSGQSVAPGGQPAAKAGRTPYHAEGEPSRPAAGSSSRSASGAERDAAAPAEPPARPLGPAVVERVSVPNDSSASLVRGLDNAPPAAIFVPGLCSNANAYLQAFPEAARRAGGVVAVEGDAGCGVEGFHSFSWDASRLHTRIRAALAAVGHTDVPPGGFTLIGYSQGASLAEQLVQRFPAQYARIVLIGAPTDPTASHFREARAVVTMSCSRDVPWRMKGAAKRIDQAGIPAIYVEMPNCTHGNIADGDRSFDKAFTFLATQAKAAP